MQTEFEIPHYSSHRPRYGHGLSAVFFDELMARRSEAKARELGWRHVICKLVSIENHLVVFEHPWGAGPSGVDSSVDSSVANESVTKN